MGLLLAIHHLNKKASHIHACLPLILKAVKMLKILLQFIYDVFTSQFTVLRVSLKFKITILGNVLKIRRNSHLILLRFFVFCCFFPISTVLKRRFLYANRNTI